MARPGKELAKLLIKEALNKPVRMRAAKGFDLSA
jgi:hypothetical protein